MSFSLTIAGHSSKPHNAVVKKAFEDAVRTIRANDPDGQVSGTGYSNDNDGRIDLNAAQPLADSGAS